MLSDRGLTAALESLAARDARSRSSCRLASTARLAAPVEAAAYYVVAEALANVASTRTRARSPSRSSSGTAHVVVEVADDGVGGAEPAAGSGLRGLADRVEALDGRL